MAGCSIPGTYSTAPVSVPVHTVQHQCIQYSIQMSNSQDPIMAPPARRKKYEASFKLKVVNFAMEHNNCAAARQYGVTEKMVRDWKANEKALKSMPRGKCALRRGTSHWPELEKHVADMVNEHRQNGYVVTRNKIRLFALQWAKSNPDHSNRFKATVSWCTRFLGRHNMVLRQKTKIAQKLPADLDSKVNSFHRCVIQQRTKHGYALSSIGNMDETPMNFDMVGNKTVHQKETLSSGNGNLGSPNLRLLQ
ncbi:hypothetical protein Chor_007867 [Crotalus horridus]